MFPRIDSSSPPLPESRQNNNNSNNSNSNELHGSSRSGGMEGAACSTSSNKFSLPSSARHKRRSVSSHNCDSKNNTTGRRGVLRAADKPLTVDRLLEAAVGEENTFNQSLLQLLPSPVGSNHNSNNNNNNNNNNNVFASSSVCSSPSKRASYQRAIRVPPVVTDRRPSGAAAAALMVHSPSANSISNFMSLIPSAPSPRIVGANDSISSAASSIRRRCRAAPHMVPSISGRRQMNSDGDYSPVERTPPPLPSIPMRSPSKATTAAAVAHVPNSRSVSCCTTHSSASAREAACYYGNEPSSDAPMGLDALSATTPNHNSKLNNVYETDNLSYCSPLSPHDLREAAARRYAEDNNNNNTTASTNRSNNVIYSVVDSPHISSSYREALTPSAVFGAAAARSSFRCSNPLHNSTAVSHSSMSSMGAVMMRSGDMGMMLHRGGGAGGCSTPAFVSQPLPTPPEKPFQGVVPARRELGVRRDGVRAAPQSNWSDADGSSAAATLESPSCTPSKKSSNNNNYTFDRLRYRGEAAGISSARSLSSLSSAPSASGLKRADRKVYASGANNNNNNSHHTHHKQHCGYSGHSTTHYFFYKGNREQGNCLPPHRQVVTDAPFSPIGGDADCHTRKTLADHNNNNHSNSVAAAGEDSVLFYEDADTNAMEEIGQRLRRYLQQVSSASVSTADVHGNPTVAVPAADDYLHVNHATKNALKPIESLFRIFPVDDELDAAQGQFHLSDYYAPCQVCMQSKKDRKLKKKRNRNRDSSFYWGGGGGMLTGLEDSGDLTCDAYSCCSCSYCEVKLNGGASVQQQEEKEEEENNEASVSIKRQQRSSSPPPAPLVDECVCGCTYCQKHRRSTRKKLKPQTGNAALPATNNPGKAAHHRSHPTRFAQIDKNCDNNNNNNNKYNCNDDEALYGDREAVPRTATPNIMCIDLGNDNYYYVDPKHAVGGAKLIAQAVLLEDQKQKQKEKKCDASPRKWHRQHHRHGYLINMRALLDQSNNGTPIGEHNNNNNKRERYACDADEEAHVEPHPACPYAHCHNSTNDKEEDDEDDEYDVNHIGKDASLRNNVPHRSRGKHTPRRSLKETKTFASPFLPSFPDAAATTITTDENESDYYYHTDGASSPYIGGTAIVKDCGLFSDGQQQQQQQQCVRHTCGPDDCDVHACGAAVLAEEAARKKKSSKCLEVPPPILARAHDVAATTKLSAPWNHGDDRSRDDNSNAVVQDAALGQRYVDAAEELEGGGMFFLPTFASPLQGPNVEGKR